MIVESFMMFIQKIMLFTSYINTNSSFAKPLSQEDETRYLQLAECGDESAKQILIEHNLRLVAHVVKKYSQTEEADDLISVGSLGLIKAINSYRMNHGTLFSTYAAKCIENEILMLIRANKKHKGNVSIEDVLGSDDENNEITIGDLSFDECVSVETLAENELIGKRLDEILLKNLSSREYEIMCMRYGLKGSPMYTQMEVAEKLGISRSYISRLEKKSLECLRRVVKFGDYR